MSYYSNYSIIYVNKLATDLYIYKSVNHNLYMHTQWHTEQISDTHIYVMFTQLFT